MILEHRDSIFHVDSTRAELLFKLLTEKKFNKASLAHPVLSDNVDANTSDFDHSFGEKSLGIKIYES